MAREFAYGEVADFKVEHGGVTRTLREWAAVLEIPYPAVRMRFKRGKRDFAGLFGSVHFRGGGTVVTHQARGFLDDFLGFDLAQKVRMVADEMGMATVDVVREFVKHGVEKLNKHR